MDLVQANVDSQLTHVTTNIDLADATNTYFRQGELAVLPHALPEGLVAQIVSEVDRARAQLVRKRLPGYKRSESLSWLALRERAPTVVELYRSPAFIGLVESLTDASVMTAPDWDPHACAVYHYARPGDGIGFHYDTSWYRGVRYTVLVGLVNDSSARLVCELHTREPQRTRRTLEVRTDPGTVVLFHGDKIWHRVTPVGPGETRTVLTLQYVTDPRMGFVGRAVSSFKDAFAYFGAREVLRTALAARSTGA